MKSLDLKTLREAVGGSTAAFRVSARLKPAGGDDDKVFPPTYSGGVYAMEERLINGVRVPCVLLDSVQSQANRLEEALRNAWERGDDDTMKLKIPMILTDFSNVTVNTDEGLSVGEKKLVEDSVKGVGRITTLDAPHRIADAIFRDSVTKDNKNFRDEYARAFDANISNATALYELCPTALVFGTWDSTGSRGGLGNKFARALVSEIVGINAVAGVRTSSRIDPLGITAKVPLYQAEDGGWTSIVSDAKMKDSAPVPYVSKAGKGNPSAVNHSNVTPDIVTAERSDEPIGGGVTIAHALQSSVLSLPALRRLRFPTKGSQTGDQNTAARTVLAALGLVAISEQWQQGYFLRSRCDLVAETPGLVIERVNSAEVKKDDRFALDPSEAIKLLNDAVIEATENHSLPWNTTEITLAPKPFLVAMVSKSRELELGEGGE